MEDRRFRPSRPGLPSPVRTFPAAVCQTTAGAARFPLWLVALSVFATVLPAGAGTARADTPGTSRPSGTASTPETLQTRSALYESVAAKGRPATVGIYCVVTEDDQYYGTGVILSQDGYILTSTTVVPPHAAEVTVYFHDHTRREARIVAHDTNVEAILLQVKGDGFPVMPVARAMPAVGDRAYTFGNADNMIRLGEGATFSAGVISGIYAVKSADSQSSYSGVAIETDAAINPGQDGGPLLNAYGQLAGIVSLSFSHRRQLGMAVPIQDILRALPPLHDGTVTLAHDPLVTPLPTDLASESPFLQHARDIAQALIRIDVNRQWKPEILPRKNWAEFLSTLDEFAEGNQAQRRQAMAEYFIIDRLLGANQAIRRPGGPVTGLVVTPEGHILTSAFNVHGSDLVYEHKADGYAPPAYPESLTQIFRRSSGTYRIRQNRIRSIHVHLPNGRRRRANVIAWSEPLLIALLKVDLKDGEALPHVDLRERLGVARVGMRIAVLGVNEDDAGFTFNKGIVSAEGRQMGKLLQFDAMLNYGNSGGPVMDRDGRIVGIAGGPIRPDPILGRLLPYEPLAHDTASQTLGHYAITPNGGIATAARIDQLLADFDTMLQGQSVTLRGSAALGVFPDASRAFSDVVVIGRVLPASAAGKAGIQGGDILVSLDGDPVRSWREVFLWLMEKSPGDPVDVRIRRATGDPYVLRNGERHTEGEVFDEFLRRRAGGEPVEGEWIEPAEELDLRITLGERE